jgi:hypothetical protein
MDISTILDSLHMSPVGVAVAYAVFWFVSAALHTIPEPTPQSPWWYVWLHNIAQLVPGNIGLMRFPNAGAKK